MLDRLGREIRKGDTVITGSRYSLREGQVVEAASFGVQVIFKERVGHSETGFFGTTKIVEEERTSVKIVSDPRLIAVVLRAE